MTRTGTSGPAARTGPVAPGTSGWAGVADTTAPEGPDGEATDRTGPVAPGTPGPVGLASADDPTTDTPEGGSQVPAALRGYAPEVRPPVLDGGDVRYVVEDLASGRMLIATRPDGALLAALFAPDDTAAERALERLGRAVSPRVLRGGPGPSAVLGQLTEFLDGRRRAFELDLDPRLTTPFQWTVLQRLADQVGYGRTTSYGALATTIGRPTASRAVGAALGANPLCIVLPCHRVVAASGALTGYAGGLPVKRMLLDLESGSARLVS